MSRDKIIASSLIAFYLTVSATAAWAKVELNLLGYSATNARFATLARDVGHRTSIELAPVPLTVNGLPSEGDSKSLESAALAEPWIWVQNIQSLVGGEGRLRSDVLLWLRRGGFLIIESPLSEDVLTRLTAGLVPSAAEQGPRGWQPIPPDHELMRSFYLLDALPSCSNSVWRGFHFDGRLAILMVPYGFLATIKDAPESPPCANPSDMERSVRIFVNLVMVALATDYKKDQIHLPEILKRLR